MIERITIPLLFLLLIGCSEKTQEAQEVIEGSKRTIQNAEEVINNVKRSQAEIEAKMKK
jgi:uncharacterized protein YcfL